MNHNPQLFTLQKMEPNTIEPNHATFSPLSSLKLKRFTYQGWKEDYYAIIQSQLRDGHLGDELKQSSSQLRDRFLGMINKQRLLNGDRSHSQIAMLDSLQGCLNYPGWKAGEKSSLSLLVYAILGDILTNSYTSSF
jgi:hypothetical protein